MKATLYTEEGDSVRCTACSHRCRIAPGRKGICAVRQNTNGELRLLVYGKAVGLHVDPIEKKPFYHFLPGTRALSFGTVGCDFSCAFCQNWEMSQASKHGDYFGAEAPPEEIVRLARREQCESIAYTYNEPAIFIEYAHDTAKLAKEHGLRNVFVSNGYETEEAFQYIEPYLDAINVDLKAFTDAFYRKRCGARLQPVLDTIKRVAKSRVWLEVTTLVIPGENDSDEELREIAGFIASLNRSIPWHISRFFPMHRMQDVAPTPLATLTRAERIGRDAGLHHIYIGNVGAASETRCTCGEVVIERDDSATRSDGRCPSCGEEVAGVWN